MSQDEFAALLDGVYLRRRAELLEQSEALVEAVRGWSLGTPGAAERAALHAHRLAGGLGTLGFLDLCERAHALERRAAGGAGPSPDDLRAAQSLLAGLRAAQHRPS